MKTKLTLFVTVLAVALFGMGCASSSLNKGLLVYYPSNGNAKDESGNGYDAVERNGPALTSDRHGKPEKAYKFDGIDDYLILPSEMFVTIEAITLSTWVNLDSSDNWNYIFSGHREGNDNYLLVQMCMEDKRFSIEHVGHEIKAFPIDDFVGSWEHLVITREVSGKGFNVYVGGEWKAFLKHNRNDALTFASGGVLIGPDQDNVGGGFEEGQFLKGSLDDYRIYNRALSAKEVKALYDLEKPKGK